MTLRTHISGPRWAGLRSFLNQVAQATDTQLTIEDESKGLIQTEIFFSVEGTDEQISQFKRLVIQTVREHNK